MKLIARGEIQKSERVVVISTAHGLKFTKMKVDYHEGTLADVLPRRANQLLDLPADAALIKEKISRMLER